MARVLKARVDPATMKFDTTRPSAGCIRGPYGLKMRAMRVTGLIPITC